MLAGTLALGFTVMRRPASSRRLRPLLLAGALLCSVLPAIAADRISGHSFATRSEVMAPQAMAATSHPLATQIALDVLKAGGSAVDAAMPPMPRWG